MIDGTRKMYYNNECHRQRDWQKIAIFAVFLRSNWNTMLWRVQFSLDIILSFAFDDKPMRDVPAMPKS